MSRKAIVVAGLSAVAIAASGCSGDSDAEAISKFRAAFKERFGTPGNETSWYGHITGMKVSSGRLEIAAELDPKSDADYEIVRTICGEALGLALFGPEPLDGVETAGVIGSDVVVLGNCA